MENNLIIDSKKWIEMYNLDFTPYLETIVRKNKKTGETTETNYVSWVYVEKLLKQNFPTYEVRFVENRDTGTIYHYDTTIERLFASILDSVSKADVRILGTTIGDLLDKVYLDAKNNTNAYLLPYIYDLETRAETSTMFFPIMDYRFSAVIGIPDSTTLNKNIMRAKSKCVAVNLGIALRAWSGEDFDSEKPVWLDRLRVLSQEYSQLTKEYHPALGENAVAVNFGKTVNELTIIARTVSDDIKSILIENINTYKKKMKEGKIKSQWLNTEVNKNLQLSKLKEIHQGLLGDMV